MKMFFLNILKNPLSCIFFKYIKCNIAKILLNNNTYIKMLILWEKYIKSLLFL